MPTFRARTMGFCAGAFVAASLAGVEVARYSEGDAFAFYKQRPSPWPDYSPPQPVPSVWSYPASGTPAPQVSLVDPSVGQTPYDRDQSVATAAVIEPIDVVDAAAAELAPGLSKKDDYPRIEVAAGSWTEPAKPQPAVDKTQTKAPSADTPDANARKTDDNLERQDNAPANALMAAPPSSIL